MNAPLPLAALQPQCEGILHTQGYELKGIAVDLWAHDYFGDGWEVTGVFVPGSTVNVIEWFKNTELAEIERDLNENYAEQAAYARADVERDARRDASL